LSFVHNNDAPISFVLEQEEDEEDAFEKQSRFATTSDPIRLSIAASIRIALFEWFRKMQFEQGSYHRKR
jgi:hypothetical protein